MDEDQPYPKGAGPQAPDAIVQIVLDEKRAREIDEQFLKPRGIMLAGPMLFGPDDAPSYILSSVD
jgi:hypothetical protein